MSPSHCYSIFRLTLRSQPPSSLFPFPSATREVSTVEEHYNTNPILLKLPQSSRASPISHNPATHHVALRQLGISRHFGGRVARHAPRPLHRLGGSRSPYLTLHERRTNN